MMHGGGGTRRRAEVLFSSSFSHLCLELLLQHVTHGVRKLGEVERAGRVEVEPDAGRVPSEGEVDFHKTTTTDRS
jgi:hypothetical protein